VTGSVRQLPSGAWELRYELKRGADGKRQPRSKTVQARTKGEAEKKLREILWQIDTGSYIEPKQTLLADYLDEWVTQLAALGKRPKTIQSYRGLIKNSINPHIGRKVLQDLTAAHVKALYIKLVTEGRRDGTGGLSGQTVQHVHRVLSEALKSAARFDRIPFNPCDKLGPEDMPRVEEFEGTALTDEQTTRLLEKVAGTALYIPVLLAIATGMRRGEVLGLRWQDVDLDAGMIQVRQQVSSTTGRLAFADPKTKKAKRPIDLPPPAVEALRQHKGTQAAHRLQFGPAYENNDLVVAKADGKPWHPDALTNTFREFLIANDLPRVRFHDLRHGHATQLISRGTDLKTVSERMGHSGIAITADLYGHGDQEARRRAAATLTDLFPKNGDGGIRPWDEVGVVEMKPSCVG
jgi:integrase